jgi:xanthine dehydrogenase accessory factor
MDVWHFIESKSEQDIGVLLMVVVQSEGSSPGRQGFMMGVARDGDFTGTIGGGIMEHKLVEKAKAILAKELFSISLTWQYHDKKKAANQSGMICSGSQVIAFVPISKKELPLIKEIIAAHKNKDRKNIVLSPSGLSVSAERNEQRQTIFEYKREKEWNYNAPINQQDVVHIFGGGHVGLALSKQLALLDFYIKIYDNRPALNTLEENIFANEKHIIDYEKINDIEFSPYDYVVIVTVGYKTDKLIFKQLLGKKFFYAGMMGSDAKIKTLLEVLEKEGHSPQEWKHFFLPIGLPVHSRTAGEIAVSIAAQMIQQKNKNLPTGRKDHIQ